MVEVFEQDIKTNDRQSSKGNQLKWNNSGIWYKADYTGYEEQRCRVETILFNQMRKYQYLFV